MNNNIITLLLVAMAVIHSAKAQQTEDLTLQGAKGKLAATLQMPKIEKGKEVRMVIICHGFGGDKDRPQYPFRFQRLWQKRRSFSRYDRTQRN